MKLASVSHGPDWVIWVVFAIFAILSVVLLSGKGSGLIAGYNTASKEEKAKYDEKKLCRTVGIGLAVIAVLILVMGVFADVLPSDFSYVALGMILADCAGILIAGNTICKKR